MKKLLFAFLSITFLFASCAKDGAVGPQGPQGNANVQGSTYTVSSWTLSGVQYYADLNVPTITQAVLDKGLVLVYIKDGTAWRALPFTQIPAATYTRHWSPSHEVGYVRIIVADSDRTAPPLVSLGTQSFKVVVVPASLRKMPKVDWNNYAEVAKAFNLPD